MAVGFFPLDEELGLLPGMLTPRLQESLVRLSTHIPSFAKAAVELAFFTQVEVHRSTATRLTETAGAIAVALDTADAAHILHTLPDPPTASTPVVLSVDGAMVPLEHGEWAEARTLAVGVPQVIQATDGSRTVHVHQLSYFSRLTDSTTFGELATVEIHRRGVSTAPAVGAVVDGAEWCQTFLDLHVPQAVRILDLPHAADYVDAIGQTKDAADVPLLDTATRRQLCHDLKHKGAAAVLPTLQATVTTAGAPGETATQLAYLDKRQAQMNYPAFQAAGWPIGSGMVESANKLVVEERLKGPGMHWARAHINPMLALRNAICSDRWDVVWAQIETEQRRMARAQRTAKQQQRRQSAPGPTSSSAPPSPAPPPSTPPELVPKPPHPWKKPFSIRRQRELAAMA